MAGERMPLMTPAVRTAYGVDYTLLLMSPVRYAYAESTIKVTAKRYGDGRTAVHR